MTTTFSMQSDARGFCAFAPKFADNVWRTTLSADVEQHFVVGGTFSNYVAVFSFQPGTSVFVDNENTATVPGSSFADETAELNPAVRNVVQGSTLSFITHDTSAYVTVSLYGIP